MGQQKRSTPEEWRPPTRQRILATDVFLQGSNGISAPSQSGKEDARDRCPNLQPPTKRGPHAILRTAPITNSSQPPGWVSANYLRCLLDNPSATLPSSPWEAPLAGQEITGGSRRNLEDVAVVTESRTRCRATHSTASDRTANIQTNTFAARTPQRSTAEMSSKVSAKTRLQPSIDTTRLSRLGRIRKLRFIRSLIILSSLKHHNQIHALTVGHPPHQAQN